MRLHQRGQAMVEYVIILPVLVMLIFGTVQAAFIYSAKSSLNYAAFQGARLGALNGATYKGIRRGLVRGLTPLFAHGTTDDDMQAANDEAADEVDNFLLVTRISPSANDFGVFGEWDDELTDYSIANDNLMYRPATGIQDANLLKIRVQYCYELIVPIVDRLLSAASRYASGDIEGSFGRRSEQVVGNYSDICQGSRGSERRGIVIASEVTVRMQSAPEQDIEGCSEMTCL